MCRHSPQVNLGEDLIIEKSPGTTNWIRLLIFYLNHVPYDIEFVNSKDLDIVKKSSMGTKEDIQYEKSTLIKASKMEMYKLMTQNTKP